MASRTAGVRLRALFHRLVWGDRDYADPAWEEAADEALTRAEARDERLRRLQRRTDVVERRR